MSRRVVIGQYADGVNYGLRVSLATYDALLDNSNDAGKFSFDSNWTDIVKIHQAGIATIAASTSIPLNSLPFPDLGYIPFFEARMVNGTIINDDYVSSTRIGVQLEALTNGLRTQITTRLGPFAYAVYRVPIS